MDRNSLADLIYDNRDVVEQWVLANVLDLPVEITQREMPYTGKRETIIKLIYNKTPTKRAGVPFIFASITHNSIEFDEGFELSGDAFMKFAKGLDRKRKIDLID